MSKFSVEGLAPADRFSRLVDPFHVHEEILTWQRNSNILAAHQYKNEILELRELLRLETLSAILLNEQLQVPQTQLFYGDLPSLYAEISAAIPDGKDVPLIMRQPFRPSMQQRFVDFECAPLVYQMDVFERDRTNNRIGNSSFDHHPDYEPQIVRGAINDMCKALVENKPIDAIEIKLAEVFGENTAFGFIGLARSYMLSPPRAQGSAEGDFGTRVRSFIQNPAVQTYITNNTDVTLKKHMAEFIATLVNDEELSGRGDLNSRDIYKPYSHIIKETLKDIWPFVLHQELSERIGARRTNLEALPRDKTIGPILNKLPQLSAVNQYAYRGRNYSAVDQKKILSLDESEWRYVWKKVASYITEADWDLNVAALQRARRNRDPKEIVKSMEDLILGFQDELGDKIIIFNIETADQWRKRLKYVEKIGTMIQLFGPAVFLGAEHVVSLQIGKVAPVTPIVGHVIKTGAKSPTRNSSSVGFGPCEPSHEEESKGELQPCER